MKLYTYWRSSAAYRVRIALELKGLSYESVPKHLLRDGGEQRRADYLELNPQGLIPGLEDDGFFLGQSLAICEYLEEIRPAPPLLPADPRGRATVRSMALAVACDIHPLNNLRVQQYLRDELGQGEEAVARWTRHWMSRGFTALEGLVARHSGDGRHCFGTVGHAGRRLPGAAAVQRAPCPARPVAIPATGGRGRASREPARICRCAP